MTVTVPSSTVVVLCVVQLSRSSTKTSFFKIIELLRKIHSVFFFCFKIQCTLTIWILGTIEANYKKIGNFSELYHSTCFCFQVRQVYLLLNILRQWITLKRKMVKKECVFIIRNSINILEEKLIAFTLLSRFFALPRKIFCTLRAISTYKKSSKPLYSCRINSLQCCSTTLYAIKISFPPL